MKLSLSTPLFVLILCIMMAGIALPVFGQEEEFPPGGGFTFPNPIGATSFEEFIENLLQFLIIAGAPVVAVMVAIGGLFIMVSGPSPNVRQRGIRIIKWAVLGYAAILIARLFVAILMGLIVR